MNINQLQNISDAFELEKCQFFFRTRFADECD